MARPHQEAVPILYGLANYGNTGAAVALERALRDGMDAEPVGELGRLLRDD